MPGERVGLPVPRMTAVIVHGAVSNRVAIVGSDDGDRRLKPSNAPKERRACHCTVCGDPGHSRRSKQCRLAPEP